MKEELSKIRAIASVEKVAAMQHRWLIKYEKKNPAEHIMKCFHSNMC